MSQDTEKPADRIIWLQDGPHRVEHVHQAEYAAIVKVKREEATQDELIEWRIRP